MQPPTSLASKIVASLAERISSETASGQGSGLVPGKRLLWPIRMASLCFRCLVKAFGRAVAKQPRIARSLSMLARPTKTTRLPSGPRLSAPVSEQLKASRVTRNIRIKELEAQEAPPAPAQQASRPQASRI